jgi:hypothetical protein
LRLPRRVSAGYQSMFELFPAVTALAWPVVIALAWIAGSPSHAAT